MLAASNLSVDSAETLESAAEFVRRLDDEIKDVKEVFGPMKQAAHAAHQAVCTEEKQHLDARMEARGIVRRKIGTYQEEQRQAAEEERLRLQAEADKQAADLALQKADVLMQQGRDAEAEAVMDNPPAAPIVRAPPPPPNPTGVVIRTVWKCRVVSESLVPRQWLMVNEKALGAHARSTRGTTKVAGVEFYSERV